MDLGEAALLPRHRIDPCPSNPRKLKKRMVFIFKSYVHVRCISKAYKSYVFVLQYMIHRVYICGFFKVSKKPAFMRPHHRGVSHTGFAPGPAVSALSHGKRSNVKHPQTTQTVLLFFSCFSLEFLGCSAAWDVSGAAPSVDVWAICLCLGRF